MTHPTEAPVSVEQSDREAADAIATALASYAVAYQHATYVDMSGSSRWHVHKTGEGSPFDRAEWLGEFDNKADASAFCADLRRQAAYQAAARHRLAATQPPAREEWQPIATAPRDEDVLLGYYGDDANWRGFFWRGHLFQWPKMERPLATGSLSPSPTHWRRISAPTPPATGGSDHAE